MGSDIFDLVVILILVAFSLRGFINGFLREVAGIVSIVGGFICANTFQPRLSEAMDFISNPSARYIVAYVLIFVAVMLLVSLMVRLCHQILEKVLFSKWIDNTAGFFFGLLKGIFVCSLILYVVQTIFIDAPFVQNSRTLPYLTTIIERIREWIPDDIATRITSFSR